MEIKPSGSVPTRRQPKESFTGVVWQDPIIEAPAPARIRSGRVSSSPAHAPPGTRIRSGRRCMSFPGSGGCRRKAGRSARSRPGDTVWIPPGEKHWHGAGPNTGMVHIAMQEALDGKHVEWMEYVTDEEYGQAVGGS